MSRRARWKGRGFPRYPALWAASALVLAVLALPYVLAALGRDPRALPGPGVPPSGRTAQEVARRVVTLRVKGMTCPSCPFIVQKALEGVPGVAKPRSP